MNNKEQILNRERLLEEKWDKCKGHIWKDTNFIIDTNPPTYSWYCTQCYAITHDTETEEYCFLKHPKWIGGDA